jgi:hypothetical protein
MQTDLLRRAPLDFTFAPVRSWILASGDPHPDLSLVSGVTRRRRGRRRQKQARLWPIYRSLPWASAETEKRNRHGGRRYGETSLHCVAPASVPVLLLCASTNLASSGQILSCFLRARGHQPSPAEQLQARDFEANAWSSGGFSLPNPPLCDGRKSAQLTATGQPTHQR